MGQKGFIADKFVFLDKLTQANVKKT